MAELIILSTYKSFILNKNSENKVSFFILKACIINAYLCDMLGFPGGSVVKNLPAMRKTQVRSWVGKIPWRRKWQPTLVFLPGKSHGQRGHKSWTRLSNYTTTTTRHARMFSSTSWQRNWRAESHVFTVDPKVKWLVCVSHMITELLFFFNWVIINSYTIKFRSF